MLRLALLALAALAGCQKASEAEAEVRQYELMKRSHASFEELCGKARKVANAYLSEENQDEYQLWDLRADADCNEVQIERLRP